MSNAATILNDHATQEAAGRRAARKPLTKERSEMFTRLRAWTADAITHGVVYSRVDVGRTGMSATVLLWTITKTSDGKPCLSVLWPSEKDHSLSAEIASRLGFSWKRRAFVVGGCGFDRADHVMDNVFHVLGWSRTAMPRVEMLNQPE